jgi:predicted AlkP superfamily phosphohydrolase/phosphomutase
VIGLDGAPYKLLMPWIQQKKLPNLARLVNSGVSSKLISTIPPCTAAAWSSFLTGMNPGKHGIFEIITRRPCSYSIIPVNASHRQSIDIFDILSSHNKQIIALNVPFTYPPKKINGFMITGMITPPRANNFTYPLSLQNELNKNFKKYKVHTTTTYKEGNEELFLKDLYEITAMRKDVALHFMKTYEWDVFMIVFNGTDQIQHGFWKYFHSNNNSGKYRDAIFRFYKKMDEIIGELLTTIDSNTNVIILSDHGAERLEKWIHINTLLLKLGLLKMKGGVLSRVKYLLFKHGFTPLSIYKILLRLKFGKVRKRVTQGTLRRLMHSFSLTISDVDWSKTKAYAIPGMGQLFINLKGREAQGIVELGNDYDELRELLISELHKLRDSETGKKVINTVFKKESIYSGPFLLQAQDIQFLPNTAYTTAPETEFGSNKILSSVFGISAKHTLDGILVLNGPKMKKGIQLRRAEIIDVAPTILYLMGIPIPLDMDGKVLSPGLRSSYLERNPILYDQFKNEIRKSTYKFSAKDEEEIKDRLRNLGYL